MINPLLRLQLHVAKRNGLAAILTDAAKRHGLEPAYVLAIASRETGIRNIAGDFEPGRGYHGYGPMQLDDRSHLIPAGWRQDPSRIINLCCAILAANIAWAAKVRPHLTGTQCLKIAAARYNARESSVLAGIARGDCDWATTGGDYGRDVLKRMAQFAALLAG